MAMSNEKSSSFEVPGEVREFADRSVEQARKAVDSLMSAAQKASSLAETSAKTMQENATQITSRTMQHAQANIKAAFDLAQGLAHAKTLDEVATLQGNFMKGQLESLQAQATEFGGLIKDAATKATTPS